ncbi:hypothetical protein [Amycolatopsis methanolica]|uniref:Uncharacterized protein n=1 Tax=Amycolatopsis methanolica 239 TaxID=1068978 RepID=A0A076MX26_AMYME|nr:hypothetical protein [Amycolatopsis methanolica]AIJ25283.1 hypothetical protein AMETH_5191 [Amycolatopsis methanolica 239]
MRLIRLERQPSRVADDVRAALAALGRGDYVAGGIALAGARPLPDRRPVEAIVIMPTVVLVVIGVDLPDPAIRLEAPLTGQWKADGWPLVADGDVVNPAADALALADAVIERLRPDVPEHLPIATILAVGPFVEEIEQPPTDLAGNVRVLFPTQNTLLAAIASLTPAPWPCTPAQARALIGTLTPDTGLTGDELAAEGFTVTEESATVKLAPVKPRPRRHRPATPAAVPPIVPPAEVTMPVPRIAAAAPAIPASAPVPWRPVAAIAVALVLLAVVLVLVTTGGDGETVTAPPTTTAATPAPQAVAGIEFTKRASGTERTCAARAYGDLQARLQASGCAGMERGSFEATVDGRAVAVSVAVLTFGSDEQAAAFKQLADTPGSGGIADLATETHQWPREPDTAGAAYQSTISGPAVRLVLAAYVDGQSSPDDPALLRAAGAALGVRIS